MGSGALAAAVSYPGKATQISHNGQWNTKKFIFINPGQHKIINGSNSVVETQETKSENTR